MKKDSTLLGRHVRWREDDQPIEGVVVKYRGAWAHPTQGDDFLRQNPNASRWMPEMALLVRVDTRRGRTVTSEWHTPDPTRLVVLR